MIPHREVLALRTEWQLRDDVIEKDYVLGWLIGAIAAQPELEGWVFKGGTALRKCFYETYRLSEDLDFTVVDGPEEPADLHAIFERVRDWMYERAGIELVVDARSFRRRKNKRGKPTTEGRLGYRGPSNSPITPKVKLDITSDEVLVAATPAKRVHHPYSDEPEEGLGRIRCYSIAELLAEKIRALAERCRPRDLYDVVLIHRHADLVGAADEVASILKRKCIHAGIQVPDKQALADSPYRAELEQEWENMLGHQLPHLPPFEQYWAAMGEVFEWLAGRLRVPKLQPVPVEDEIDESWAAPRMITTWSHGAHLELIRYAGANRLKVDLEYWPKQGRGGVRRVEPYSLRMTRAGNLLLYVINDRDRLRSYIVERIGAVRVSSEPFAPRFRVEF